VQEGISEAVAAGNLTMDRVALSVRRLMRVRVRLGMFDPPMANPYNAITNASVASPEHLAVAELAARKGMTLLKNGTLILLGVWLGRRCGGEGEEEEGK
jgi:beta-glucosidase